MDPRVRYRGARGQFISREQAERENVAPEYYEPATLRTLADYTPSLDFAQAEQEDEQRSFWDVDEQERVIIWKDFEAGTPSSLGGFDPPEGVTKFRVFFDAPEGEYVRGWPSTTWMDMSMWPSVQQGMVRGYPDAPFNHVRFSKV